MAGQLPEDRLGGACTIEAPWPGYRVSPCAYLAGLLHPLVIKELDFPAYGYHWTPAVAGMFVPFDDGHAAARVADIVFGRHEAGYRVRSARTDGRIRLLFYLGGMRSNGISRVGPSLVRKRCASPCRTFPRRPAWSKCPPKTCC